MKKEFHIFIVLLFAVNIVCSAGCSMLRPNDPGKKAQKQIEKDEKQALKEYNKEVDRRMKNQSKETRKRMKKNLKKADKRYRIKKKDKSIWKCTQE